MISELILRNLIEAGRLRSSDRILAVCASRRERDLFAALGFVNVTISNLDEGCESTCAPFAWAFQDAENLTYSDKDFDAVFVQDGLHHCQSPHRALLEMYRVAKLLVIVIESRDSLAMRLAIKLGYGAEYELEAVSANDMKSGGVRNSPIPNFVYRWTEREVEKTIRTYEPQFEPKISYFYGLRLPIARLTHSPFRKLTLQATAPIAHAVAKCLPRQCNEFGFVLEKRNQLQSWLKHDSAGRLSPSMGDFKRLGRLLRA